MKLVSLDNLKVFCDVVSEKSFSQGAALNGISQSAASQTVLQLEKRLGTQLIDRSRRPFALTAEGRAYYEECREILNRYIALEERVRSRDKASGGRVTVACIYSIVLYGMERYAQLFQKDYPDVFIRFRYLHPDEVYEAVLNEEADLGLLSFPKQSREIRTLPWLEDQMALVCRPDHRLASLPQARIEDLDGENFVAFESGLGIRKHIDQFLRRRNVRVNPVMSFDNIEFIKRGVETGAGVALLPEACVRREVKNGSLRIVALAGLELTRPLSIIYRHHRALTPATQHFVKVLRQWKEPSA